MYRWLLDYLNFNVDEIYVGKEEDEEIVGGYIRISDKKFQVNRGVLIVFPRPYYYKLRKIVSAYRNLNPLNWSSRRSDWIKHLRRIHTSIVLRGLHRLGDRDSISILSLGCGWGWEILLLVKRLISMRIDFRIIGCDIALKPLFLARTLFRRLGNINFMCCPAEYLPFKPRSFDMVTAIFGALDHSVDYIKTFVYISKIIKKGGVFVGTVLNRFALDWIFKVISNPKLFAKTVRYADRTHARIRIPAGDRFIRIPTHFYSGLEVNRILRLLGFKVILQSGIFSFLPPNFKKRHFSGLEKLLSKIELYLNVAPIIRDIGRYIGFVAVKQ